MKAISLWQPWASAVALGIKQIETRSWQTYYTGPIAIHAARRKSDGLREDFERLLELDQIRFAFEDALELDYDCLPFGAIIATATLVDCVRTDMISHLTEVENALGNFSPGRYGWILTDRNRLPRIIPCRGGQRIFNAEVSP